MLALGHLVLLRRRVGVAHLLARDGIPVGRTDHGLDVRGARRQGRNEQVVAVGRQRIDREKARKGVGVNKIV